MQRLFSTFPDGWPGTGLLVLRVVAAIPAVQYGFAGLPHFIAAAAASLLLAGCWTPIAGLLLAVTEVVLAFSHSYDPWTHILLGSFGVAIAMLGPGAWSVDARLFGRKRIQIPRR